MNIYSYRFLHPNYLLSRNWQILSFQHWICKKVSSITTFFLTVGQNNFLNKIPFAISGIGSKKCWLHTCLIRWIENIIPICTLSAISSHALWNVMVWPKFGIFCPFPRLNWLSLWETITLICRRQIVIFKSGLYSHSKV